MIGSNQTALETALLLRIVVSNAKFKTIDELLEIVKSVGQLLTNSQPKGWLFLLSEYIDFNLLF